MHDAMEQGFIPAAAARLIARKRNNSGRRRVLLSGVFLRVCRFNCRVVCRRASVHACCGSIRGADLDKSCRAQPCGNGEPQTRFREPMDASTGTSSQALPVSRLEVGLGCGWETVFQMRLLRVSDANGTSVLAGGQFSMALQYLLAGSPGASYAPVSGRLEVPSGVRRPV